MLVPLTRKKFEDLIPLISTGAQYLYCWGKLPDFLRRLLISVIGVVLIWFLGNFLGDSLQLLFGLVAGLYWLWAPVLWASRRNAEYRRYKYSGFWQGQVLDVFISEELIGKEETVNQRGDLVIIENRERRLNLEVGDESGFSIRVQVPLRRNYQLIRPADVAEMLVLSNQADLSRIAKVSDVYIPTHNLWVSDYPYLQRDVFEQVSRALRFRRKPTSRVD
jgi:hypothetical protein